MVLTGNHALDTAMSLACDANPKSEDIPQAVAGTLYAEVIRQRVIIEDIRALLETGPSQHGRSWRDDEFDRNTDTAHGAEIADAQWESAIRKALGE